MQPGFRRSRAAFGVLAAVALLACGPRTRAAGDTPAASPPAARASASGAERSAPGIAPFAAGASAGPADPAPDPAWAGPAPRTSSGFRNPGMAETEPRWGALLRWQWQRLLSGLPRDVPGGWHPAVLQPDLEPFRARRPEPRIVWLGHDTFLLAVGGTLVMTDPQLSERAGPLSFIGPRRRVPVPVAVGALPHVDIVVISHDHYDHLDRATVLGLNAQAGGPPLFLVPLGAGAWMRGQGIGNVRELDWWDSVNARGLKVVFVPARHFSGRTPFAVNRSLWGGWIVDHPTFRFYFAGDTGYGPLFREIGRRFAPIDLAAIPIGSYEPRWFMSPMHVDPEEAVRIHLDVGARRSVGMHWGTFQLTDEALDEPPKALARALAAARLPAGAFFTMGFGEVRQFAPRPAAPVASGAAEREAR